MRKQTYRIITGGLAAALVSGLQLPAVTAYASVTNEVQAFRNNVPYPITTEEAYNVVKTMMRAHEAAHYSPSVLEYETSSFNRNHQGD